MQITLVNTHDLVGGAERCSYDLAQHFLASGDSVQLMVGGKFGDDPFVNQLAYRTFDWKLRSFVYGRLGLTDTTIVAPIVASLRDPFLRSSEVVNVHNMHGSYWNFWTIPILARRSKVVITLHDEWLMTGDCAYTYSCERWKQSCGDCPQAREPVPEDRVCIGGGDLTWLNLKLKRAMFRLVPSDRLELVTPSRWLLDRIAKVPHLARFPRRVIPNGVALDTYRPLDRQSARASLDLPREGFLVLCLAANLYDRRKNLGLVLEALRSPSWPARAKLVIAGRTTEALEAELGEDPRCILLGYLEDRERVALVTSACDLMVVSSRADNLPYTALEAQACGTPVLGARVGGILETFRDGETGWSFELNESGDSLARKIAQIASRPEEIRAQIGAAARRHAEKRLWRLRP